MSFHAWKPQRGWPEVFYGQPFSKKAKFILQIVWKNLNGNSVLFLPDQNKRDKEEKQNQESFFA